MVEETGLTSEQILNTALDNDPQAVVAARENVRLNDLQATVQVDEGSLPLDPPSARSFDLVVANVSRPVLTQVASDLEQALRPDGLLVLSGLLTGDRDALLDAYAAQGLDLKTATQQDEWLALVLGRRSA